MEDSQTLICNDCPRNCNMARSLYTNAVPLKTGFCRKAFQPTVARAALHHWEEPCISGTNGSGAVFFGGCNLQCVFCQNAEISHQDSGIAVTPEILKKIYTDLISQGAHNINLVTPTHYIRAVTESLDTHLSVPVIYNCGGYEKIETIRLLKDKIQIWLPDLKYLDEAVATRYGAASDYPRVATRAIKEMYEQTGPFEMDDRGLLTRGIIIRHLILPGNTENSKRVIDWVETNFSEGQVLFSLMRQYIPHGKAHEYPEIAHPLTTAEYKQVEQYLFSTAIEDGFVQEEESADSRFIPKFDGTGVPAK